MSVQRTRTHRARRMSDAVDSALQHMDHAGLAPLGSEHFESEAKGVVLAVRRLQEAGREAVAAGIDEAAVAEVVDAVRAAVVDFIVRQLQRIVDEGHLTHEEVRRRAAELLP